MSDIAICVDQLSKLYRIGRAQQKHDTLRDAIMAGFRTRTRRVAPGWRHQSTGPETDGSDHLWALKDVSFEIKRGQATGIIGANGAGKSTLLKILSRITEPTTGRAIINGRVGSLLEVGTGFHPELTGRENVYLNGAILGMRRSEIEAKFDEIVAFAEVEKFLDTPVKRYSSGMYVRLAFAVAAHLEPEVLLIDEVLAVGDASFQSKCLGKMQDVAGEGRTVLFVSHNMGAITQLCAQSLLMRAGRLEMIDRAERVVGAYLFSKGGDGTDISIDPRANPGSGMVCTRCWIGDGDGRPIPTVDVTQPFTIGLHTLVRQALTDIEISVRISNGLGQPIFTTNLSDTSHRLLAADPGSYEYLIDVPGHFLVPDTYTLAVSIHRPFVTMYDLQDHVVNFKIEESGSQMWQYQGQRYGSILVNLPWRRSGIAGGIAA